MMSDWDGLFVCPGSDLLDYKVLVDPDVRTEWGQYRWRVDVDTRGRTKPYYRVYRASHGRRISLARTIMGLAYGEQRGTMVDHINDNPLDNRRANLRLVTAAENHHRRKNGQA